ncbi:HlyD family type I secretion periplasmic adaptor subunit [uncultured Cohaesibacter sp.]|uniref:HlyD family type I secretion periplasmic adaptor subunit n=1 Tax=uncultured Cohaesibacter sp. TaxID=1002546 RepID=UPI0029C6BA47|nr:HlyD family type I secretion periplasmic adaptor subunit [uncultured Cohaesibacter sp.]
MMSLTDHTRRSGAILSISRSRLVGVLLLLGFFAGFGYWAASAPLMGAVVATGWVVKEGRTQSITHERGGVVSRIYVQEGQRVQKGEVLALIEDVDRMAEKQKIETRLAFMTVKEARLMAEEQGRPFDPGDLLAGAEDVALIQQFVRDQRKEFDARHGLQVQQEQILTRQKNALEQELQGLRPEVETMRDWRDILSEQESMRMELLEKGAVSKVALQETRKDLKEVEAEYLSKKAQAEVLPFRIAEVQARLEGLRINFQKDVATELAELRSDKNVEEKGLRAAETAMERIELKAPASGVVDQVHINTIGSAVAAYQPIIEIVPDDNPILVEVEVNPSDVEQIQLDQKAKLALSAYDSTEVPPVEAQVIFVSPNRRVNQQTMRPYFVVRLEIAVSADLELPPILPGMPIEAFIETEPRTFLEILVDPLTKSLRRSFRA